MIPLPPPNSPIKDLERLWLRTAVAYEQFDENLMEDHDWDKFAKELNDRRSEWSPYFANSIPGGREGDFNVGTTASGVDWRQSPARLFYLEACGRFGGDPLGLVKEPS